jgi:hypothetical protein
VIGSNSVDKRVPPKGWMPGTTSCSAGMFPGERRARREERHPLVLML